MGAATGDDERGHQIRVAGSRRRRVVRLCIPGPDRDLPRHRDLELRARRNGHRRCLHAVGAARERLAVPGFGDRGRRLVGLPRGAHPLGDHATVATGQLAGPRDRHARCADHDPGGGRDPLRLQRSSGRQLAADGSRDAVGRRRDHGRSPHPGRHRERVGARAVAALPIEPVRPRHRGGVGERALGSSDRAVSQPDRLAQLGVGVGHRRRRRDPRRSDHHPAGHGDDGADPGRDGGGVDRRLPVVSHRHDRRIRPRRRPGGGRTVLQSGGPRSIASVPRHHRGPRVPGTVAATARSLPATAADGWQRSNLVGLGAVRLRRRRVRDGDQGAEVDRRHHRLVGGGDRPPVDRGADRVRRATLPRPVLDRRLRRLRRRAVGRGVRHPVPPRTAGRRRRRRATRCDLRPPGGANSGGSTWRSSPSAWDRRSS